MLNWFVQIYYTNFIFGTVIRCASTVSYLLAIQMRRRFITDFHLKVEEYNSVKLIRRALYLWPCGKFCWYFLFLFM